MSTVLVVRVPFGSYAVGDTITDAATIAAVETKYARFVTRAAARPAPAAAPKAPAATRTPEG